MKSNAVRLAIGSLLLGVAILGALGLVFATGFFIFLLIAIPGLLVLTGGFAVARRLRRRRTSPLVWGPSLAVWLIGIPLSLHFLWAVPSTSPPIQVGSRVAALDVTFSGGGEAQPGAFLGDIDFDNAWWTPYAWSGYSGPLSQAQRADVVLTSRQAAELQAGRTVVRYRRHDWWDPEQPNIILGFGRLVLLLNIGFFYVVSAPVVVALAVVLDHLPRGRQAARQGDTNIDNGKRLA